MKKTLSCDDLKNCIDKKILKSSNKTNIEHNLQPSSLDIALGNKAFLIPHRALIPNSSIEEFSSQLALDSFDLSSKTLLLKNQTYLIETNLEVDLPSNLCAKCSPKSSIGRIDVLVRAVCSTNGVYDIIEPSKKGKIYLEVTPQSFNILVQEGVTMSQIRIFKEEEGTNERISSNISIQNILNQSVTNKGDRKLLQPIFEENMLFLSVEINNSLFGYVAKHTHMPIDLTKIKSHSPLDFFEPVKATKSLNNELSITIEKNKFYIFHTKELINVVATHSIEMLPYSYTIGDFRAHYAGFFDPGFGGEHGATGVLEIRSSEDIVIFNGQPICSITAYENSKVPKNIYGENNNNYQNQKGPKLSKFFKDLA